MFISMFSIRRPVLLAAQDVGGGVPSLLAEPLAQVLRHNGGAHPRVVRVHYDGVVIVQDEAPCVLPTLQITQAHCGLLDVPHLEGDATVTVALGRLSRRGSWCGCTLLA
jgi:hypothetical protein